MLVQSTIGGGGGGEGGLDNSDFRLSSVKMWLKCGP